MLVRLAMSATEESEEVVDSRYVIERELGRGGMGVVYAALDAGLDRRVAIKLMSAELAKDARLAERFRAEAKALAAVRHEHVVQVHTLGVHRGASYFSMELVAGRDLARIIEAHASAGGVVPLARSMTILEAVGAGLAAVHAAGLVHRDVTPANVVIEEGTGRPVLVDFGIADRNDARSVAAGSPLYAPFEQLGGDTVTHRSDVYSFGVLAFELLTGRPPFTGVTLDELVGHHAFTPAPLVSSLAPELRTFDPVIARALAKSPDERYGDMPSMIAALQAAFAASNHRAPRTVPPPPPSPTHVAVGAVTLASEVVTRRQRIKALVADDDPAFQELARRAVELAFAPMPVDVEIVGGGEEATEAALETWPDLVILDYDMPDFDGIEVLTSLRAAPRGKHVRTLVLTTEAGLRVSKFRFRCLGVTDFEAKPIKLNALVHRIVDIATRAGWIDRRAEASTLAR